MPTAIADPSIKLLAFFQRAFGLRQRYRPFEEVERRSASLLHELSGPPDKLEFRLAIANLPYNWDLLTEEASNVSEALRLQSRMVELAPACPAAEAHCRELFSKTPTGHLFRALVAKAQIDQATNIEFSFADPIVVRYFVDGEWRAAATVPSTLESPLKGILRLVETAQFSRVKPFFESQRNLPEEIEFEGSAEGLVTLTLA